MKQNRLMTIKKLLEYLLIRVKMKANHYCDFLYKKFSIHKMNIIIFNLTKIFTLDTSRTELDILRNKKLIYDPNNSNLREKDFIDSLVANFYDSLQQSVDLISTSTLDTNSVRKKFKNRRIFSDVFIFHAKIRIIYLNLIRYERSKIFIYNKVANLIIDAIFQYTGKRDEVSIIKELLYKLEKVFYENCVLIIEDFLDMYLTFSVSIIPRILSGNTEVDLVQELNNINLYIFKQNFEGLKKALEQFSLQMASHRNLLILNIKELRRDETYIIRNFLHEYLFSFGKKHYFYLRELLYSGNVVEKDVYGVLKRIFNNIDDKLMELKQDEVVGIRMAINSLRDLISLKLNN